MKYSADFINDSSLYYINKPKKPRFTSFNKAIAQDSSLLYLKKKISQ